MTIEEISALRYTPLAEYHGELYAIPHNNNSPEQWRSWNRNISPLVSWISYLFPIITSQSGARLTAALTHALSPFRRMTI